MPTCAFLSTDDLEGYFVYDELCYPALAELGWSTRAVPWRAEVDWRDFDLVVIRSPWDYHQEVDRFLDVLARIDRATRLENSLEVVRWNIDKRYLRDLESQGVPAVPTLWREAGAPLDASLFESLGSERAVIKPTVSASAHHTYVLEAASFEGKRAEMEAIFATRDSMIQPFVPAIVEEGEISLFFFSGELSHAILKTPREGDFRVQEEHGGRIVALEKPSHAMIDAARRALAAVPDPVLYGRVDLVRYGGPETYVVMELELIEPSLYFPQDPGSPERFARAIDAALRG
ncbi:MAG: hypothetical protein AAF725_21235 [Acidobacteriota bacterium]